MMPNSIQKCYEKNKEASRIKKRQKILHERELMKKFSPIRKRYHVTMEMVPTDILPQHVKTHFLSSREDQIARTVRARVHQRATHELTAPKLIELIKEEKLQKEKEERR